MIDMYSIQNNFDEIDEIVSDILQTTPNEPTSSFYYELLLRLIQLDNPHPILEPIHISTFTAPLRNITIFPTNNAECLFGFEVHFNGFKVNPTKNVIQYVIFEYIQCLLREYFIFSHVDGDLHTSYANCMEQIANYIEIHQSDLKFKQIIDDAVPHIKLQTKWRTFKWRIKGFCLFYLIRFIHQLKKRYNFPTEDENF
jgi:hypothetical protein